VWAIAASFWFLESGIGSLAKAALEFFPDEMSRPGAKTECTLVVREVEPIALNERILPILRIVTWNLGFATGFERSTTERGIASQGLRERNLADMAGRLGVPVPKLPEVQHVATMAVEFRNHIETDAQCIAAILSYRYSPKLAATYQFASFFGYVYTLAHTYTEMRHDRFLPDLRYYGRAAGIPDALWVPIVSDVAGLTPEHVRTRAASTLADVDRYMQTGLPPEPSSIDAFGSPPASPEGVR
jgi:hypothetical protein